MCEPLIMQGRLDVRVIEDIGDNTLNFAQAEAITSGNPLGRRLSRSRNWPALAALNVPTTAEWWLWPIRNAANSSGCLGA